jgi:hypothetical protein
MKISWKGKLFWILKNPYNLNNKYYEITSEEFFQTEAINVLNKMGVDLFFIDGLHTFSASLNDALSSLKHLSLRGTVIMHDCCPPHIAAAIPATSFQDAKSKNVEGWTGQWCGDVWKTIVYLKTKYSKYLDITVINSDFGLGVIKFKNEKIRDLDIDVQLFNEINELEYQTIFQDPGKYINLKELSDLN